MPKRNSYSIQYKLAAVKRAENTSNERAARDFRVDAKQIREWKKRKEVFEQLEISKRKRLPKGEGEFLNAVTDDTLGWALDKRSLTDGEYSNADVIPKDKCLICYVDTHHFPGTFHDGFSDPITTVLRLFNLEQNFPIISKQSTPSFCQGCLGMIEAIKSTFDELQILLEKTKHFRKKVVDEVIKGYNKSLENANDNQDSFHFRKKLVDELNLMFDIANNDDEQFNRPSIFDNATFNEELPEQNEDSNSENVNDSDLPNITPKVELPDISFLHNENSDNTVFDMETFEEIESKRKLQIRIEKLSLPSIPETSNEENASYSRTRRSIDKTYKPESDKSCSDTDLDFVPSTSSTVKRRGRKRRPVEFDEFGNVVKRKRIRKPTHPDVVYEKCREASCPVKFRVEEGDVEARLEAHYKKVHLGIKAAWVCRIPGCNRNFHSVTTLKSHEEHGHGEDKKSFLCESCGQGFKESHNLKSHVKNFHAEKPFSCKTCPKIFATQFQLDAHEERHVGRLPYKCSICEERFLNKRELQHHCETTGHPIPVVLPFSFQRKKVGRGSGRFRKMDLKEMYCVPCDKYFASRNSFKHHEKVHLGNFDYKCDQCDYKTTRQKSLELHQVVHSDERKFSCEVCEKAFKRKQVLIEHMRKHTGERPYKCAICEKQFTGAKNLRVHMRSCDKTINLRFECIVCGMKFTCRSTMAKHIKTKHENLGEEEVQRILVATRKDRWDNLANPNTNQFKDLLKEMTNPQDLSTSSISLGSETMNNEEAEAEGQSETMNFILQSQ